MLVQKFTNIDLSTQLKIYRYSYPRQV